ncbi:hypothetical protein PG985_002110 [Apiospora marii]|uniref:uncharacterized protein n=1 Tax=Apiospora marii TaxID=335849 RepID=UPI0031301FD6
MPSQGQHNLGTGDDLGHSGVHWSDLSGEERQDEYAADNCNPSENHGPLQSEEVIVAPSTPGVAGRTHDEEDQFTSFQIEALSYMARRKRSISPNQDGDQNKRPCYDPGTLRERPSQNHRFTRIGSASQEQQSPGMRIVNVSSNYENLHSHGFQFNTTTTGLFTPTSTMQQYEHASQCLGPVARPQWSSYDIHHGGLDSPPSTMAEAKKSTPNQAQNDPGSHGHCPPLSDSNDDYPLDSDNEHDMLQLLDSAEACIETHMPPSSVLNMWDRDSRSADVYDENLQYSPPSLAADPHDETEQNHTTTGKDDFLDEDVDWDAVYAISASIPKDASLVGSREREEPCTEDLIPAHEQQLAYDGDEDGLQPPAPFQRSRFPEKVHDRSVIRGLSSEVVLRTCFRIEELLEQAAHCYNHHQQAVFELYARVKYSNREELARKQYFLLGDLFEDQERCLSGTLSKWKAEDPKDQQGQAFLGADWYKMCRCMCKVKRDSNNEAGWVLDILDIRETNWDGIRVAKMIVGEDSGERADE